MLTTFLLQMLSVLYIIVGFSMLLHPAFYLRVMNDTKNSPALMYFGGIATFVVGFFLIFFHNIWGTPQEIIITIIGWIAVLKGICILLVPDLIEKMMDIFARRVMLLPMGILVLILGLVMGYLGYMV